VKLAGWALVLAACSASTIPDFYGVRLGMSPRDVRERFAGGQGAWTSEATRDDYAVHWTAAAGHEASLPDAATFEFHTGALVAVRADLPASASFARGHARIVTKSAVLSLSRGSGKLHADLLARDCPTHATEAAALAAAAP
jgi:hypothetical protein